MGPAGPPGSLGQNCSVPLPSVARLWHGTVGEQPLCSLDGLVPPHTIPREAGCFHLTSGEGEAQGMAFPTQSFAPNPWVAGASVSSWGSPAYSNAHGLAFRDS